MSVVGVEIRMFGPLPGIKYCTDELDVGVFPPPPAASPTLLALPLLLFNGVVVGVKVALLLTFAETAVAVGYNLAPLRIKYCCSSDTGKNAN